MACPTSLVGNWANELGELFETCVVHQKLTFAVKWLGPGAINPLVVDGKGGKAELIPAVRRWVNAHGRNVTLPGELPSTYAAYTSAHTKCSHDCIL